MISDGGLQIFMVAVIVGLTGLIVWYLTDQHHVERYKRMVKQYTFALDTLSESNTELRDKNGELEKRVKELESQLRQQGIPANGHVESAR